MPNFSTVSSNENGERIIEEEEEGQRLSFKMKAETVSGIRLVRTFKSLTATSEPLGHSEEAQRDLSKNTESD
jgi:hypothetical protein